MSPQIRGDRLTDRVPVPGKAVQRQEPEMAGTEGDNFLLVTSLITCIELRNYLPPPNPREVKTFERAAPEAQSYLILIHILLAFGLLVRRVTGIQTPKRVEAHSSWS